LDHPFLVRDIPVLFLGEHVTTEAGTGLCALRHQDHGVDDFNAVRENALALFNLGSRTMARLF